MSTESENASGISNYDFREFSGKIIKGGEVKEFEIKDLDDKLLINKESHQKIVRNERDYAKKESFRFSPVVEKYRGIKQQEERDYSEAVEKEVQKRLGRIREEAHREGFKHGEEKGFNFVVDKTLKESEEKIVQLSSMIGEVHHKRDLVFEKQRKQMYELLKTLTKWIILKEVEEDDNYLERLLMKLILEIQEQSNLLIRVNEADFEGMPEILDSVQKKVGKLTNVRIEVNKDFEHKGISVECESNIIDGSLESQFELIDSLFEASDAYGQ
ncbi:MAG: hypothetical protein HOE90_18945 [Bacteriovoracaceae bacterium]|jgi:flagellar assembly protein FliH|nr:hypothetical protein [Bacteriovoracaceae bacterium]